MSGFTLSNASYGRNSLSQYVHNLTIPLTALKPTNQSTVHFLLLNYSRVIFVQISSWSNCRSKNKTLSNDTPNDTPESNFLLIVTQTEISEGFSTRISHSNRNFSIYETARDFCVALLHDLFNPIAFNQVCLEKDYLIFFNHLVWFDFELAFGIQMKFIDDVIKNVLWLAE